LPALGLVAGRFSAWATFAPATPVRIHLPVAHPCYYRRLITRSHRPMQHQWDEMHRTRKPTFILCGEPQGDVLNLYVHGYSAFFNRQQLATSSNSWPLSKARPT
jgi:hypothetical protein